MQAGRGGVRRLGGTAECDLRVLVEMQPEEETGLRMRRKFEGVRTGGWSREAAARC